MLSGQQRNAIGCQKIGRTYALIIKAFRRAYKVSRFDTVTLWTNIRMREGETASAFANRYQGLLPADSDLDNDVVKHNFIMKLPKEVRTQQIRKLYEQQKSFDKIAEERHEVYDWLLSHGNKRSRTQVNAVQDDDEEAEQEEEEQAAVNLVSGGESRPWKSKSARTDQGPSSAPDARMDICRSMSAPPAVWSQGKNC